MPHKVGEQYSPGAVDEKVRAEVATYAWIETNCPDIPIPYLHAFGLSSNLQFTHGKNGADYFRDASNHKFKYPYMLLDYIESERGMMLSDTLHEFRETDQTRMHNLCRGISHIMLSLASQPQSQIGSLRFNDDCSISLSNRPVFCANSILESEGAPKIVDKTYATSGSFIDDMLRFREEVFRAQPNAVNDEEDCHLQMLHMSLLRRWKPQLVDCQYEGPFVLQFTDLHASNIFVDDQWNIVALIDLEFVCALPPSMMHVPHWLSVDAIEDIRDCMPAFIKTHETFIDIFRHREKHKGESLEHKDEARLASLIQNAWTSYSYWFYLCLTSVNAIPCCVEDHLYERFDVKLSADEEKQWAKQMSSLWSSDFAEQKILDKAKYDRDVVRFFDTQHFMASKDTCASTTNDNTL